jgi:hypothetical protein
LEKIKDPDETILHIVTMEKVKYSRQIESENTELNNDYAPVGFVVIPGTNEIVNFGNCIPIIFDPTRFEELHKNWNEVGYTVGPCSIQIIESDTEFDLYLMAWLQEGMQPIVHPMFDKEKELQSGAYIQDIKYFTDKSHEHSYPLKQNPDWRKGDRARIIFPGPKREKVPEGIVMTDEFIDEYDESCVIFCPVEDGIELTDLAIKIPVNYLSEFNRHDL